MIEAGKGKRFVWLDGIVNSKTSSDNIGRIKNTNDTASGKYDGIAIHRNTSGNDLRELRGEISFNRTDDGDGWQVAVQKNADDRNPELIKLSSPEDGYVAIRHIGGDIPGYHYPNNGGESNHNGREGYRYDGEESTTKRRHRSRSTESHDETPVENNGHPVDQNAISLEPTSNTQDTFNRIKEGAKYTFVINGDKCTDVTVNSKILMRNGVIKLNLTLPSQEVLEEFRTSDYINGLHLIHQFKAH